MTNTTKKQIKRPRFTYEEKIERTLYGRLIGARWRTRSGKVYEIADFFYDDRGLLMIRWANGEGTSAGCSQYTVMFCRAYQPVVPEVVHASEEDREAAHELLLEARRKLTSAEDDIENLGLSLQLRNVLVRDLYTLFGEEIRALHAAA